MNFGLSEHSVGLLTNLFRSHPEIEKVQIFGSRAMGNYRENSDIDLVIWGNINEKLLATISAELDQLPLPYLFDLKIYFEINHSPLKEHIDTYGKDIYVKNLVI